MISAPYIYGTLLEDTEENVKEASSQAVEGAEQDLEREMDISEDTDSEAEAGGDVAEIVEEGAVVASGGYTLTALCNMTLQGNVDQVYQFIEKIEKNYPALQVRSMHMSGRTYLDGNWDMIEQPEVSFELAVYMHEDEKE